MARLAYYAPGVYVEEVPSARQPIAGVGTNTVGFIGLVPDVIYVPVSNPDYDPVLAKSRLEGRTTAAAAAPAPAEAPKPPPAPAGPTAEQLAAAKADVATADQAKKALPATATDGEKAAAQAALDAATKKNKELLAQADAAKAAAAAAATPAAAATAATGAAAAPTGDAGEDYDNVYTATNPPPDDLLKPVPERPYYFKAFDVKAAEFATKLCTNFSEYTNLFGEFSGFGVEAVNKGEPPENWKFKPLHRGHHLLTHAVNGFFVNGGTRCFVARVTSVEGLQKALTRFESIDDVAIIAAPGLPKITDVWELLESYCEDDSRQNVFGILDSPAAVTDAKSGDFMIRRLQPDYTPAAGTDDPPSALPRKSTHAAYYFPHIEVSDPAKRLQDGDPARQIAPRYRGRTHVAPSGHVAGIYARTDEERGVHKAPANATVRGALEVKYYVSKPMQEMLNPQGVNCIRLMNGDVTVWGARTIGGDRNGEWKYINVRRFAGFLEESIDHGTQWVVFEPNDPNLWSRIILNITAFLTNVWRSGALFGLTPQEAFYVKCDAELNTPDVRDLGQVITEIGVAIVRPAEFVIFRITQSTGLRQG